MFAAAPAEGVSSFAFSHRLITQFAPGQSQEHAFETRAVYRQPFHPIAEPLEEIFGKERPVGFDDDGAVPAIAAG